MNGEITKEAVSLMRRAAELTNNEEIKFAAAHIQSEFDKKHPRQPQDAKKAVAEKPRYQAGFKKPMNRSSSAPNVSSPERRKQNPLPPPTIQSQLPRKRWTPRPNNLPFVHQPKVTKEASDTIANLEITKEEAAQLQSVADRTRNPELKSLCKKIQQSIMLGGAQSSPTETPHVTTDEALTSKSEFKETSVIAPAQTAAPVDLAQSAYLPVIWKDNEAPRAGNQEVNAQGVSDTSGYTQIPVAEIQQEETTSRTSQLQSFPENTQNVVEVKQTQIEDRAPLSVGLGTS